VFEFLSSMRRGTKRVSSTSWRQLTVEQLEGRTLLNAASVLASLQDANIRTLAQADYSNSHGSLTRDDMIGIFNAVAKEGTTVNSTELSDLATLVNNGNVLGMQGSVEDLAGKVIGFNPANVTFHGKKILSSGQLDAGQAGSKLTDLVDKWFLGEDLPVSVDAWGDSHAYAMAKGSLFGPGGPTNLDVVQGEIGDCYFLSPLAETAARDPQAIRDMFVSNGDGTYTVRFFEQSGSAQVADYVTVNCEFPADSGQFVFADMGRSVSSTANVLWVPLAEKAYAQLAQEGWSRAGDASPANSYGAIDGGNGYVALQQVLGESTAWVAPLNSSAINTMINDLKAGDLITLASNSSESSKSHVIADHEYYVTGYNAATKTFTVVNPWGANLKTIGTLHLTAAQVEHYFSEFDEAAG